MFRRHSPRFNRLVRSQLGLDPSYEVISALRCPTTVIADDEEVLSSVDSIMTDAEVSRLYASIKRKVCLPPGVLYVVAGRRARVGWDEESLEYGYITTQRFKGDDESEEAPK